MRENLKLSKDKLNFFTYFLIVLYQLIARWFIYNSGKTPDNIQDTMLWFMIGLAIYYRVKLEIGYHRALEKKEKLSEG